MAKNGGGMIHPPGKIFHAKRRSRDEHRWDVKNRRGDAPSPRENLSSEQEAWPEVAFTMAKNGGGMIHPPGKIFHPADKREPWFRHVEAPPRSG
jgi:hypothetical protein